MAKTNEDNTVKNEVTENSLTELIGFLDSLPEPKLVINADYTIVGANKSYQESFGSSKTLMTVTCSMCRRSYITTILHLHVFMSMYDHHINNTSIYLDSL